MVLRKESHFHSSQGLRGTSRGLFKVFHIYLCNFVQLSVKIFNQRSGEMIEVEEEERQAEQRHDDEFEVEDEDRMSTGSNDTATDDAATTAETSVAVGAASSAHSANDASMHAVGRSS